MSRTAWTAVGSLLAVPALGFGTTQVLSAIAHEQEHVTRTFDAADVVALDVDGSERLTIVGDDVDEITVTMRISHGLRRTGHTEQVVDGVLVIDTSCPVFLSDYCQVEHTIRVPRDLPVRASNDNGRIELRDLAGPLDVDADNGRIEGTGLRSTDLRVSNDNGRIELDLLEPVDRLEVDNDNGRIEVVLPDVDEGYAVTAETDNGSTETGVRTDPSSPRTIWAENDNGDIVIRRR